MKKFTKIINRLINVSISMFIKLILFALVLLALVRGSIFAYNVGYEVFGNKSISKNTATVYIDIEKNENIYDIANKLKKENLIESKYSFIIQAQIFSYKIQEGHYEIEAGLSIREILNILSNKMSLKDK